MKASATQILAGRREGELLAFPSVRRMADILTERCREQSWVRTSVASLERFRMMTGQSDLELLLDRARAEPAIAEEMLARFASVLAHYTESQVSALAMGTKIWFRLNSVSVRWRPLPGRSMPAPLSSSDHEGMERVLLLALIGSGLRMSELLRLRVRDVGSLDNEGRVLPELESDPLAVRYTPARSKQGERITFLTYAAQQALLRLLVPEPSVGQLLDADALLFAAYTGGGASSGSIKRARQRSQALIRTGSDVNVTLCRTTGDFFREWGLPGSRFEGVEDLRIEEYI